MPVPGFRSRGIQNPRLFKASFKPHLHDIHFGSGTPKSGHAGSARLIFCRVNAKFLARSPKELGEPGPPREVVLASLNSGPRAKKRFCGAFGH